LAEKIEVLMEEDQEETVPFEEQLQKPAGDKCDEHIEHLQRLKAEFDNYRKRIQREQKELEDHAKGDVCGKLLPILDDLKRAMAYSDVDREALRSGIELVHKNLKSILQTLGLETVPAQGQPFDPHVHEAVIVEEARAVQGECVTNVLQTGYLFKGKLLRPAKVTVSKT
jgi:molecular chaperone GrpE